jgi:(p)ppGpp synthase/HD superfamily hydrolase
VTMATCCNPIPGDPIIGYVTRGYGIKVHHTSCKNYSSSHEAERWVAVTWGSTTPEELYTIPIEITAFDRSWLLADISTIIAKEGANIARVEVQTRDEIATLFMSVQLSNPMHLNRLLSKIESVQNVVEARRRFHS